MTLYCFCWKTHITRVRNYATSQKLRHITFQSPQWTACLANCTNSKARWWQCSCAGLHECQGVAFFIDRITISQMHCEILNEKMLPLLRVLGHRALFQHNNNPKHTSKAKGSFLRKKRFSDWAFHRTSVQQNTLTCCLFLQNCLSPSSIQDLKEFILQAWRKIEGAICLEVLLLFLNVKEAVQNIRLVEFVVGCTHFCITLFERSKGDCTLTPIQINV